MCFSTRTALLTLTLTLGLSSVSMPLYAEISVDLAKTCRALMIKAHPTQESHNRAPAIQRDYFKECIRRQGRMDKAEPSTTGQGNR